MGETHFMDYIYSYLNDDVASREMHGSETNTAVVTVNAATNIISVDVKPLSPSMLDVPKPTEAGTYILQETLLDGGIVSYSWNTLDSYNQEVTQAISILTQQIEQERADREQAIQNEADTREEQDNQIREELSQERADREQAVKNEEQRTNSMINQLNNNVQQGFNTINDVLTTSIDNINNAILNESTVREEKDKEFVFHLRDFNTRLGIEIDTREQQDEKIRTELTDAIEQEKRERVEQDQDIRNNLSAEANTREEVDTQLSNRITNESVRTDGMINQLNDNINLIVNQLNKNLVDAINTINGGIATEIAERKEADTNLQNALDEEAQTREDADNALDERVTAIENTNVLQSQILGNGKIQTTIDSEAGRTFDVDIVDISDASNDDRFTVTLNNNDSISGKLNGKDVSVPLIFVSKWDKVEVGGSGAPLNLNSDDSHVTVNDTYTLLDNRDKEELTTSINEETDRATQAEQELRSALTDEVNRAEANEADIREAISQEANTREEVDAQIQSNLTSEIERATQSESAINTNIAHVIANANKELLSGVAINITGGNTATLDYTTYNTSSGQDGASSSTSIPMANTTHAGLMSNQHVEQLNDSVKKTGQTSQAIQGDIILQGNLTVSGTTTTNNTESLTVQDNLIITNSDGAPINNFSGLGIRVNESSTFGVVYDPSVSELKAGFGSLDDSNEFTFDQGEGHPVTLRDTDRNLTDGDVLEWSSDGNKLIDSGIPSIQIARKDQEQTFNGVQTFVNAPAMPSISVNGISLHSNVAGNIAVESQLESAITNLINGASIGYQTLKDIETSITAVDDDLQAYKESNDEALSNLEASIGGDGGNRITNIEENITNINNNTAQMNVAIENVQSCVTSTYEYATQVNTLATEANALATQANTTAQSAFNQANSAFNQANIAYEQANSAFEMANNAYDYATGVNANLTAHIANTSNPHSVTKAQVGLANVQDVDTTNASNIINGTLSINRLSDGLIAPGANVAIERNATTGVYTISAVTGGETSIDANDITSGTLNITRIATGLIVSGNTTTTEVSRNDTSGSYTITACVPVQSVAGKNGNVQLNRIAFTGACTATYDGSSDVNVSIPSVPTMYLVNINANNGTSETIVGSVYSNTTGTISIPATSLSLSNSTGVRSTSRGVVTDISLQNGVLTISYGPLDDGEL